MNTDSIYPNTENTEVTKKKRRSVPAACIVIFLLTAAAAAVHLAGSLSPAFSDAFNRTVSSPVRTALSVLTGWFPFSFAETVVIVLPAIVIAVIVFCVRRAGRSTNAFVRTLFGLLAIPAVLYTLFVLTFGLTYHTTPLGDKLGLERKDVTAEELADTMKIVVDRLNGLTDDVIITKGNGSLQPYPFSKVGELCRDSYAALSEQYAFIPVMHAPVKEIALSRPMTYTHISGVYTYYTGEANVNTNYPDFVSAFSVAHEMAHQRGIGRESEANFMAYLVCIGSDDPFMQYAGYLNMFEYLADPLYKASPTLYGKAVSGLSAAVRYDLSCYSDFFDRYRNSVAADVSDAVNNTYLVMQGEKAGSRSYGLVVDLAVAYHKTGK